MPKATKQKVRVSFNVTIVTPEGEKPVKHSALKKVLKDGVAVALNNDGLDHKITNLEVDAIEG